jgi:hypothetical protein
MPQRATALLVAALTVSTYGQEAVPKPDRFAPLRLFVGTWRGDQAGEPGQGTAARNDFALYSEAHLTRVR